MTRTVTDAALMMRPLTQPDWRDTTSLPAHQIDWDDLHIELRGLRIGLQLEAGWGLPADAQTLAAVQAAARAFEVAGAIVEPLGPFSTRAMADGLDRFWRMRSYLDMSALPPERQAQVLPYILQWVATGATLTAAEVFHGYSQMAALREAAVAACQPFDFVLSPVNPVSSYPADWASPINDPQRPFEHIAYTLPYNMSEQPAISVPCAHTAAGLPIGLQIVARPRDEGRLLAASLALEQILGLGTGAVVDPVVRHR
jgi:Asp-tRNA(Asn)/Glu-tRNA(Gln) amidotransferase A subunit family amidase